MLSEQAVYRMFLEERDLFEETFPVVDDVELVFIDDHYFDNPIERDVAWYDINEHQIYLVRRALKRSINCLRGVIRHELGHVADDYIHEPGAEARADQLAYIATGEPILYTTEGIQHTTEGRPGRPKWLHQ
jgi:hypothetical protein